MAIDKAAIHKEIVLSLNKLYKDKNNDYGDSFKLVRDKHPNAILIRLNDKLTRLETLMSGKERKVNDESVEDTLRDLANYALMELVEMEVDKMSKHDNGFLNNTLYLRSPLSGNFDFTELPIIPKRKKFWGVDVAKAKEQKGE